jgi:hypothetical protein
MARWPPPLASAGRENEERGLAVSPLPLRSPSPPQRVITTSCSPSPWSIVQTTACP